ncbi:bifunctional folylpolyglutamate synthase/dihydrofolate synthase [Tissierella pigra]|uniref:tetrahydrofolate synthase n=1 Tax=Tissierella pigra TaxID=2607614 RepID=A0A6N7XZZ5_9FIRM|nr:folylpolyglutamate synthase/dihydrofolate synthase family protein [Tissierella pigra]MBU5427337.1 bifunctional folylpolyglutamate synthase/dihydrofolate synthase [Tissierella pigra]MSU01370.1 bifunctional folylpolyglutamate synthase/dihydrofolate synthase [Tissierella pigra]
MKYQEALKYINDKDKYGSRLGLDSIGKLMSLLGNPQEGLKYIHIGGTNGKGSTSSYMAHCLEAGGYKVGLFTSPYIERFNERIQINGQDIPDDTLGRITGVIKEKANIMVQEGYEHPTTFEIVTAIGFMFFKEEEVDYVVLEVGLGGRYDSTNVISSPLASIITTLDYDHIDVLGDTLDKIAYQKAGIIKENSIVVSYPQEIEALEVIKKVAEEKNSDFYLCPMENIVVREIDISGCIFDFNYENIKLQSLKISMLGEYQVYNATLALTTLLILREKKLVNISEEQIRVGLEKTKWPGRLEVMRNNPTFLIDGAHNVQGIQQLKKALSLFKYNKLILGLGILKDKDSSHMVELLAPLADKIIATEVNMPRKLDAEDLAKEISKYNQNVFVEKDIKKAIEKTLELAKEDDMIVFGGSLYLIGEVRTLIRLL